MSQTSSETRRRRQALRGLLALADSFEDTFTCAPGDEHTGELLRDYIEQRTALMEMFGDQDQMQLSHEERSLIEDLRTRDAAIQEMLQTHRDALRGELRQVKQQKRALQGYKQAPQGLPTFTTQG